LERNVKVKMFFGKSEVKVEAVESIHNTTYQARIDFGGDIVTFVGPNNSVDPQSSQPAQKYHVIFINDTSGSMDAEDTTPSLDWITHKNRVGALYESCYTFLKQREGKGDIVSCVAYNDKAVLVFSNEPNNDPQAVVNKMQVRGSDGGTDFLPPMCMLHELIDATPESFTPIAFFMTDGESDGKGAEEELQKKLWTNINKLDFLCTLY